jgi:predicted patatin/cPLA2 family phospholipase
MFFEGNTEVFTHLLKKQRLLAAHDAQHATIRPLLLILSGTMRGVYGGGQVIALERFGLTRAFDVAVGISTGAPTVAYFLAKQAVVGTSIYCKECTTNRFISVPRLTVDVDYIADVLRGVGSPKGLDQQAIYASRSQFFVGVTCAETGEAVLIDAKTDTSDVVHAIRASIAIPGLTRGPVMLGGKPYLDGVGAHPLPIRLLLERFQPTDILVCANGPVNERGRRLERLAWLLMTAKNPPAVQTAFTTRATRFTNELEYLRTQEHCRFAVLWSDDRIGHLTQKPHELSAAAQRAEQHLSELLDEARGST